MKKYFILLIVSVVAFGSCKSDDTSKIKKSDQEVSAGDELMVDKVEIGEMDLYSITPENESSGIDRAFENAPPLVPHTVVGMVDIKMNDNECLLCHMPNKAKAEDATPIPKSHFIDYRPKITKQGDQWLVDAKENEVVQSTVSDKLENSRFFCNQCHVPQTDATIFLRNTFKPEFRNLSDKSKSDLDEKIGEGVK
ncbi:MAG: nitrate reductase cytochrome c-type subunit [Bacteroidota bacterium]